MGINTSKRRVVVRESTLSASPLSFFPLKAACFKAFIASFTESMTEVDEGDKVKVNGWGREFNDSGVGQRGDLISDRVTQPPSIAFLVFTRKIIVGSSSCSFL